MNTEKSIYQIIVSVILTLFLVGCDPGTPQTTVVVESDRVPDEIIQTKTFDQCNAASNFKTVIQFSDSNTQTSQQDLVLGAQVTGGVNLPNAVKVELTGSIEKRFSETVSQERGHIDTVSIDVPAHTRQEYTITWREIRSIGVVEYMDNGETKSIPYSYRLSLEFIKSVGKDLPCPTQVPDADAPPSVAESAATTMDLYYKFINTAGNKDDLTNAWNLLTMRLQCNSTDKCSLSNYQDWWWQWKIQYKLYDCGSNVVDTELSYYKRDPILATTPTTPVYVRYQLIDDNGQLKINAGEFIEGPGANCKLEVSMQ